MNLEKHIDNSKHLMTGYETNTWILFSDKLNLSSKLKPKETLGFNGKKIH